MRLPKCFFLVLPLAVVAAAQVAVGQAITELQALESNDPQKKGVAHELGVAYYKSGDYPHASKALQQALSQDASDKEAVQLLGLSYYFSGKPKDAIPMLEKVQSWYPRANVDAAYVLGFG